MAFNEENIRIVLKKKDNPSQNQGRGPNKQTTTNTAMQKAKSPEVKAATLRDSVSHRPFRIEDLQPTLKQTLQQIVSYKKFYEDKGQLDFIGHFLFVGSQGTGKTSGADALSRALYRADFISTGEVVRVTRKDLVGQHIGETALKTQAVIEASKGRVLFVDEAYTLFKGEGNQKDFGLEALETLMDAMEKKDQIMVFGGYRKQINQLLTANPGLEERFRWKIDFDEISTNDLVSFGQYLFFQKGYEMIPEASQALYRILEEKRSQEGFAYLRTVTNLVESLVINKPMLYEKLRDRDLLTKVTMIDIDGIWRRNNPETLEELLSELDKMVGLTQAKEAVLEYIGLVDYNARRRKAGYEDTTVNGHMAFVGSPGTGKTTLARLVGRILGAKGYLSIGHVVEVTRVDLVSQYMGATPDKTRERIKEAMGGILFIDEAYGLITGDEDRVGREALDTLIKEMEEHRNRLVVILAGYEAEMDTLIHYNPGLRSRLAKIIRFEDYEPEEFSTIFINMVMEKEYQISMDTEKHLKVLATTYYENLNRSGNGRTARNLFEALIKAHATQIKQGGGNINIIDEETLQYLKSQLPL